MHRTLLCKPCCFFFFTEQDPRWARSSRIGAMCTCSGRCTSRRGRPSRTCMEWSCIGDGHVPLLHDSSECASQARVGQMQGDAQLSAVAIRCLGLADCIVIWQQAPYKLRSTRHEFLISSGAMPLSAWFLLTLTNPSSNSPPQSAAQCRPRATFMNAAQVPLALHSVQRSHLVERLALSSVPTCLPTTED